MESQSLIVDFLQYFTSEIFYVRRRFYRIITDHGNNLCVEASFGFAGTMIPIHHHYVFQRPWKVCGQLYS